LCVVSIVHAVTKLMDKGHRSQGETDVHISEVEQKFEK